MEAWLWLTFSLMLIAVKTIFKEVRQRWSMLRKDTNWLPPGPMKLPIIGNLHQLSSGGELLHVNLAKLARKHGGIMTVWFGSSAPTIVVSDPKLAWEVLVTKASDFSSRTMPYMSRIINANFQTVNSSDYGSFWYMLRNGLQSSTLSPSNIFEQTPFQEEDVSDLLSALHKSASSNNGVVNPLFFIRRNTVKLISRFCFGHQFKDEVFFDGIDKAIDEVIRLAGHAGLVQVFEFVRYIPGINSPFKELHDVTHAIEELIRPYIISAAHKSSSDKSFLHFLLSQNLKEEVIIFNLFEIFMLAVDSVSSTTAWALAFMIHYPQAQQKLYEEVSRSESESESESVKVQDVKSMQYLNAVVKETMRMKPIAPLAVPHKATRDSSVMGTKIPAGTAVIVNLYKLLHDPDIWVQPHQFMPERFLGSTDSSGNNMERSFLPFGAGRRMCAGTELGKLQVAFTLASMVKAFNWSSADENQLPDLSEDLTFLLVMKKPLAACICPRTS